jgi:hypothetical protein
MSGPTPGDDDAPPELGFFQGVRRARVRPTVMIPAEYLAGSAAPKSPNTAAPMDSFVSLAVPLPGSTVGNSTGAVDRPSH